MPNYPDMTIVSDTSGQWSAIPHSGAADAFIAEWFAKRIARGGNVDLSEHDLETLIADASERGFRVARGKIANRKG